MYHHIVDTTATVATALGHKLNRVLVLGEQVKCQRFRQRVQGRHHLVDGAESQNGQHRPKNLLLHDSVRPSDTIQYSRRDLQGVRRVPVATQHDLVRVDKTTDAVEVLAVDDSAVVGIA